MSDEELPEDKDAKEGDDAPDLPPPSTFAGKARKAEEEGGEEGEAPDAGSGSDAAEEERARCLTRRCRGRTGRGLAPTLPRRMSLPLTRCLTPKSTLVKRKAQTSL